MKENHTETRAEEQTSNPNLEEEDKGEMEELTDFEAVTYRRNRRRQRQHVIIGTSRDSEIKAEKKKAWIYLGRMSQETTVERVRNFLNRKGRSLSRRTENNGAMQSLQIGLPFRASTADVKFGILAAGSHNKAISVQL